MSSAPQFVFAPFRLDPARACLWRGQQMVALTPKAYAVLHHLVEHAGQLVTKEALLDAIWPDVVVGDAVLKSCLSEVRKALGDAVKTPQFIVTIHRRGYRFIAPVTAFNGTLAQPGERDLQGTVLDPFPLPAAIASVLSPRPLVGRDPELARLHHYLEQVRRGVRQVVFVTGEPGIGKTALIDSFATSAATDPWVQIAYGQCVEHHGPGEAYMPVLEALGRLCRGRRSEQILTVLRQYAPTWLAQMPWLLSDAEREVLRHELSGATQERMVREMVEAVACLTAETPLIFIFEDLHWSDYATLDLITALAQRRELAQLLLLGTYRPVEVILHAHPLRIIKHNLHLRGQGAELPLELLSSADVAAYLAARFPCPALPDALARVLHLRTEGNPFFLVHMVEHMVMHELLVDRADGWQLTVEPDALAMETPDNVRQMIMQQFEQCHQEEQRVLEAASVVGRVFAAASVAAALAEDSVEHVEAWCEALAQRRHWLRAVGVVTWADGTTTGQYAFQHGLYQHTIYQRLSAARRVFLHRRIGGYAEAVHGPQACHMTLELAMHHFENGHDDRRALHGGLARHGTSRVVCKPRP